MPVGAAGDDGPTSATRVVDRLGEPGTRLLRASAGAFGVLVLAAGAGFLAQVGTARLIGSESFGTYAYVLAWVTLLGYLSTLGFHVSLLRFVPTYRARGEWRLVAGVLSFADRGAVVAGAVIALVAMALVLWHEGSQSERAVTFLIGLAAAPMIALRQVGSAAVRAFGHVVASMVPEQIVRDALAITLLCAALLSGMLAPDATAAMGAMLLSSAATLALARYFRHRYRPSELDGQDRAYAPREWIVPTVPLTIMMAADVLMSRSGVLVIGLRGHTVEAGIFSAAFGLAQLTSLPRMAVASLFAPSVAELHARGDTAGLQALITRSSALSLAGTAVVAAPLVLLAPLVMSFFGDRFVAGVPVVTILVLGNVFGAAMGPQQHMVTMTGNERPGAAMIGSAAAAAFGCGLLLAGPFGMVGAALAVAGSMIGWNIAMGRFIARRLGVRPGLVTACEAAWRNRPKAREGT